MIHKFSKHSENFHEFNNFDFTVFYLTSSLHVNTITRVTSFYMVNGSEHEWLFNIFKSIFIIKSRYIHNKW